MKLYLLKDVEDAAKIDLLPTKKAALKEQKFQAGNRETEIEEIDVTGTSKGICEFIHQYFGVSIFEN